jgi:hypothetical protein
MMDLSKVDSKKILKKINSRKTFNEQKTLKRRASQKAIEKDYKGDLIL